MTLADAVTPPAWCCGVGEGREVRHEAEEPYARRRGSDCVGNWCDYVGNDGPTLPEVTASQGRRSAEAGALFSRPVAHHDWPSVVTPKDIAARLRIDTVRPDKTLREWFRRNPPVPHARYGGALASAWSFG